MRSPEGALARNLVSDQKAIWTSPFRLRPSDLKWLAPVAGVTGGLFAADTEIEKRLPTGETFRKRSVDLSNFGVAGFAGLVGGSYLWSRFSGNEHMRETAVLSGEAAADTFLATSVIKLATGRDRPLKGTGNGDFFDAGWSFPSEHAAAAWSIASVFAHAYPSAAMQFLSYGAASVVTAARVTGRQHFTSDVFVGTVLGWLNGRQVYRAHHDPDLGGASWGTFSKAPHESTPRRPEDMGSPYVALDSWVYPAFDRLAALGYVQSGFAGLRPWTRMECARLVEEAGESLGEDSAQSTAGALYQALQREFASDTERRGALRRNLGAEIESVYARVTGISGAPLNDGFHFGQTIVNDFGRPYGEGGSAVTGISTRAAAGPLAVYARGEYQHAPSLPPLSRSVLETISTVDHTRLQSPLLVTAVNRVRLLEAYVGYTVRDLQFSFGRQNLWWGPGRGGPLLFGDNAEPVNMLRITRVSPTKLPSFLGRLGPLRAEFFWGQVAGQRFLVGVSGPISPQPFIHGEKLSFKPTPNLEFGVSKTTLWGGPGVPVTSRNVFRTLFSFSNVDTVRDDPGDRRSGFDFSYRIPKLRRWLVLYNDSMSEDEISPIGYPRRSAMSPGIYMPQIPKLPKLDLRVEAVYTDLPGLEDRGGYYTNYTRYLDGYTNHGMLLGNWVGREGRGIQVWSNYWIEPHKVLHFAYRRAEVGKGFIPGGGKLNDFAASADWVLPAGLRISGGIQYEQWNFPVLSPFPKSNVASTIQLTFSPRGKD